MPSRTAGTGCWPSGSTSAMSEQVTAAVEAAIERFGRIDVLVNNAGRGLVGTVEETSDAEARALFDVNVFGLLAVTRAVLPYMRAARSGLVVNLSSVGGFVAWPGWGVYAATKFAVEALSEAMTHELAPLGIKSVAIEPGPFRTNFLDGSSLSVAANAVRRLLRHGRCRPYLGHRHQLRPGWRPDKGRQDHRGPRLLR